MVTSKAAAVQANDPSYFTNYDKGGPPKQVMLVVDVLLGLMRSLVVLLLLLLISSLLLPIFGVAAFNIG